MRQHSIKFKIFVLMSCLMAAPSLATAPVVGYGSSNAVLSAQSQELFYMGFEAGFKHTIKKSLPLDFLTTENVWDGSKLGALKSVDALIKRNVTLIVGFPTSHEAVLAAERAKSAGIFTIIAGAGHSKLAEMGALVTTTGESMDYSTRELLEFAAGKFKGQRGIICSNPKSVYSIDQERQFERLVAEQKGKSVALSFARLNDKLRFDDKVISDLRQRKIDFILFTQYADESQSVLAQLYDAGIDIPIIANSSWTTGDVEFLRRFLAKRNAPTYGACLWLQGSRDSVEFERVIKNLYGRPPTTEVMYGYEVGVIAASIIERTSDYSKEGIHKAFLQNTCFPGISGSICFSKNGGHPQRKIYMMRLTKDGMIPVLH